MGETVCCHQVRATATASGQRPVKVVLNGGQYVLLWVMNSLVCDGAGMWGRLCVLVGVPVIVIPGH